MDTDNSGLLSYQEVSGAVCQVYDGNETDQLHLLYTRDRLFRRIDKDANGCISYDEFLEFFYLIPAEEVRQTFNF